MAPLCEGIAYTGRSLALSEEAIDALAEMDLDARDSKVSTARLTLQQASDRLAETDRSPDANPPAVAALSASIEKASAVIEQVATSPLPADVELLRQSVDMAEGIIEALGPPLAGCNLG